jgi:alanine racemase
VSFGARALIRLGALKHNLEVIRNEAPDTQVMAVIKANAYGHGMVTVAQHLGDADSFAVARLPEAMSLRESGIDKPIVLLAGVVTDEGRRTAFDNGFELVVHDVAQIDLLARARGPGGVVWLKFDTGMNRLGFPTEAAPRLLKMLGQSEVVSEVRLMTHLASADELDNPATEKQLAAFESVTRGFEGAVSVANTPAALGWPQIADARERLGFTGDYWIRPGISLFGVSPFADKTGADLGLLPVMQFEARLIAVKPLHAGARVGYRGAYISESETTLGIVAAGYGDGYTRHFRSGTPVLVNGRRVPLIGNVSMDMIAVDLGTGAKDRVGDIVTLWGGDLPVEEVAPWADAIPYELVCGVMNREASKVVNQLQ